VEYIMGAPIVVTGRNAAEIAGDRRDAAGVPARARMA
jgi:hypothetical protein